MNDYLLVTFTTFPYQKGKRPFSGVIVFIWNSQRFLFKDSVNCMLLIK